MLANQHGGSSVTYQEYMELEPDNLASIPRVVDIPVLVAERVVGNKMKPRGQFNPAAVAGFKATHCYDELSREGKVPNSLTFLTCVMNVSCIQHFKRQ